MCLIHNNLNTLIRSNSKYITIALLVVTTPTLSVDPSLMYGVYTSTFRLRDGSLLSSVDGASLQTMRGSVKRVLANNSDDLIGAARSLPDDALLKLLFLAVAGNLTVDQGPSAIPQRCSIVVDPGSGGLVFRDNTATQSVILEVLLIVSIICLLRAWGAPKE